MVVGDVSESRRRWFEALFGEARELARRRHRRRLLVALLGSVAVAAVVAGLRLGGDGGASGAAASVPRMAVSSVALPAAGDYSSLAAVGGRLIVAGGSQGGRLVAGRVTGTCSAATVAPLSLRVTAVARANCGDPALYGEHVLPVTYELNHSGPTGLTLALRIATVAPAARDGYRLGPVVVSYPQCSDCGAESIYGDGSLWVYAPTAAPWTNDDVGELFRVSERTGRAVAHWRMPQFLRALLATDRDGLWIAPSLYSGVPIHPSMVQRIDSESLYLVTPGTRTPMRSRRLGRGGAYWMVASAHSVWVDEQVGRDSSRLWRLAGASATPLINGRRLPSGSDCGEMGEGETTAAGSAAAGIYCIDVDVDGGGGVLRGFDPATGAGRAIRTRGLSTTPAPSAVLGRSVYFLEPAAHGTRSRLYRVS